MAMVINSNIMSLNAQRNLASAQGEQNQAMERLTSGKRINSAADDAAGLAIANRMTSQVRGLDQAVRNANDGISMIQTAEGALEESTNILQRMRELSVQSANGTYDSGNRDTLNAEVTQLKAELDRISETTQFNGQNVLDGTLSSVSLQVGSEANETIGFSLEASDSRSLGGGSGDIVGEATTGLAALTALSAGSLVINDQAIDTLTGAADLDEALDTINANLDGFGAEVGSLVEFTADGVGDGVLQAGTDTLQIAVTDRYGNANGVIEITGTSSMDELVNAINEQSGGIVEASLDDKGRLTLSAEDVTSLTVTDGSTDNGATGLTAATQEIAQNFALVFNDTSSEQSGVKIENGTASAMSAATIDALGINVQDDDGNLVGVAVTVDGNDLEAGDLIINGVEIGAIAAGTATDGTDTVDNVVEAINKLSDETGVVAYESDTESGAIELKSANGEEISIEYGDNATDADVEAMTGLQERNAASGTGSVSSIDISTVAGAQKAIGILDKAIEQVSETRGELGAVNNRLDFTINNLSNVSENAAAARSRIEDADFAAESANLSRAQVLQQAGTAMLAQANAAPQQVLSLLQ